MRGLGQEKAQKTCPRHAHLSGAVLGIMVHKVLIGLLFRYMFSGILFFAAKDCAVSFTCPLFLALPGVWIIFAGVACSPWDFDI